MIVELVKKSYKTIVNTPAITLYLVLFLIAINLLAPFIAYARIPVVGMILILCAFFFCSCFFAGWCQILKENTNKEIDKDKKYFPIFLEGVGKNIVPISFGLIIYIVSFLAVIVLASFIAAKCFGRLDFIFRDMMSLNQNMSPLDYINNLNDNQKYILYGWQFCFIIAGAIFNYITMFYFPAIVFETKANILLNPIKSIYTSICFTFKNFFKTLGIYLAIYLVYFVLTIIRGFIGNNFILGVILLFIYIYFICCVIMLIFNYYEAKNNSSNRSDSFGQDEIINSAGKEV